MSPGLPEEEASLSVCAVHVKDIGLHAITCNEASHASVLKRVTIETDSDHERAACRAAPPSAAPPPPLPPICMTM